MLGSVPLTWQNNKAIIGFHRENFDGGGYAGTQKFWPGHTHFAKPWPLYPIGVPLPLYETMHQVGPMLSSVSGDCQVNLSYT